MTKSQSQVEKAKTVQSGRNKFWKRWKMKKAKGK